MTAADDSDRMRKVLESRANQDEERMAKLEEELKEVYLFGFLSSTDFSN